MKAILTTPPQLFQAIFHDGLLEVAREVGFVQRLRDFHPVEFARIFCLSLIGVARLTLQEIASELGITAAAVCKRLQQSAASEFLLRLLHHTLQELNRLVAARVAIPLLSRFQGIYLLDGTILMLPPELADLFPGHGGGDGPDDPRSLAAVKIMTRFRLDCPGCLELFLSAARQSDIESAAPLSDLPAGALLLADLGFFDGETLAKLTQSGIFWLTRLPPKSMCDSVMVAHPGAIYSMGSHHSIAREFANSMASLRSRKPLRSEHACSCNAVRRPWPPSVEDNSTNACIAKGKRPAIVNYAGVIGGFWPPMCRPIN